MRKRLARLKTGGGLACLTVLISSCGRSGLKLDAPLGDDETGGTRSGGSMTGGVPATGGIGGTSGSASRGNAGSGGPPLDPGGPIPNCRADSPEIVQPKDERWIFVEARPSTEEPSGLYLVEITSAGPRNVVFLDEQGELYGWSHDGRFLAITRSHEPPHEVSILEVSEGSPPLTVAVPPHLGTPTWSRSDGRYAVVTPEGDNVFSLVIVDATKLTQKVVELPAELDTVSWSWDGRYVALAGAEGLALIDASGAELVLRKVHDERSFEPLWSRDSRYFAFVSYRSEGNRLYLFDTRTATLELVAEAATYDVDVSFAWAGNTWLIERLGEQAFFLDLDERPLVPLPLARFTDYFLTGRVSPGNKCYAYRGHCEAVNEEGLCVKTLPPDARKPSVRVGPSEPSWRPAWAGTGDQLLLLAHSEPWLVNVELDGGELTSRVVTAETDTADVDQVLPWNPHWNPSGKPDWVAYVARPESEADRRPLRPRFWNRETGESFDAYLGRENLGQGLAWSPDGRYVFVRTAAPDGSAFYVQELLDHELGRSWRLTEIIPAIERPVLPEYWQP